MRHLMIDIETLDVKPTSVVLSIGLVPFDEHGTYPGIEIMPDVDAQIAAGRTINFSTVKWWMKRCPEEQDRICEGFRDDIDRSFNKLFLFYHHGMPGRPQKIWSCGTDFDMPILASLFSGYLLPWKFYEVMDFRTLRELHLPFVTTLHEDNDLKNRHGALSDAMNQAYIASRILGMRADETEGEEQE